MMIDAYTVVYFPDFNTHVFWWDIRTSRSVPDARYGTKWLGIVGQFVLAVVARTVHRSSFGHGIMIETTIEAECLASIAGAAWAWTLVESMAPSELECRMAWERAEFEWRMAERAAAWYSEARSAPHSILIDHPPLAMGPPPLAMDPTLGEGALIWRRRVENRYLKQAFS
jgi:hypothetical protein